MAKPQAVLRHGLQVTCERRHLNRMLITSERHLRLVLRAAGDAALYCSYCSGSMTSVSTMTYAGMAELYARDMERPGRPRQAPLAYPRGDLVDDLIKRSRRPRPGDLRRAESRAEHPVRVPDQPVVIGPPGGAGLPGSA